ncbi:quinol:cytochrome C oxidoreductase [Gramella sp. AN32]|uniref:Quinol:cytochrome C oxidoreductase n=1 Tax=Christiangramia antarctica TaxID=2058158 RepID=A0ABW5XBX0_9FLAO|nr:quinol:cytochrome C oxidoreductase [Gramella sp. AN32]MCM4155344.1 quinol:cytochrome C oxidoreductase [Gramella sp. AN32]
MYTLSSKLRLTAIIFMIVGAIGLIYGFIAAPETVEEVKEMMASHGEHGEEATDHAEKVNVEQLPGGNNAALHTDEENHTNSDSMNTEANQTATASDSTETETNHDASASEEDTTATATHAQGNMAHEDHEEGAAAVHGEDHDGGEAHGAEAEHGDEHYEHILQQLQNKPWAALYVAAFFFFMISLGVMAFYAVQYAAQAGWSPVLFRVMEAITAYLLPGGLIVFLLLVLSGLQLNHLFIWMDPDIVAHDEIIQNKTAFLNVPFFLIRAAIYLGGWCFFRYLMVKNSRKLDNADVDDLYYFKKNFKLAAGFLVFFIVTESMMSWDWIMSLDPHWFSTLFGWFVFASLFVSGITTIAIISIYLKSRGYLEFVNDSHIHDLAKFMFGMSIFWTYLWFSQFMLIWYSNIPEEVVYFIQRIEDYQLPFFGMLATNFLLPVLLLMNSDYKRVNWFVIMTGLILLFGHYINIYVLVMPATVGESWFIGIPEISALLFFTGLFVFIVFSALTKAPLLVSRNPFIEESKHYHY